MSEERREYWRGPSKAYRTEAADMKTYTDAQLDRAVSVLKDIVQEHNDIIDEQGLVIVCRVDWHDWVRRIFTAADQPEEL